MDGESGSGRSLLAERHDDDDDDESSLENAFWERHEPICSPPPPAMENGEFEPALLRLKVDLMSLLDGEGK